MNPSFIKVQEQAIQAVPNAAIRSKVLGLALGLAISRCLNLPSTAVENPHVYFTGQELPRVRNMVDAFNENVIVDCAGAVEAARSFWHLRYGAAHPATVKIVSTDWGFIDTIVGAPNVIPEEICKLANEHNNQVIFLANVFIDCMKSAFGADYGILVSGE